MNRDVVLSVVFFWIGFGTLAFINWMVMRARRARGTGPVANIVFMDGHEEKVDLAVFVTDQTSMTGGVIDYRVTGDTSLIPGTAAFLAVIAARKCNQGFEEGLDFIFDKAEQMQHEVSMVKDHRE